MILKTQNVKFSTCGGFSQIAYTNLASARILGVQFFLFNFDIDICSLFLTYKKKGLMGGEEWWPFLQLVSPQSNLTYMFSFTVGGHDSLEDAKSCMELMIWKVKEDSKTKRWGGDYKKLHLMILRPWDDMTSIAMPYNYCISRNFRGVFIFANFAS